MRRFRGRFIVLAEDLPDHAKVADLSDGAFRVFIESLCFARRNRTDGHLTPAQLKRIAGGRQRAVTELCKAGLIEQVPDGYRIHDWDIYQTTEDELDALSTARSEAGKRGAKSRWRT